MDQRTVETFFQKVVAPLSDFGKEAGTFCFWENDAEAA